LFLLTESLPAQQTEFLLNRYKQIGTAVPPMVPPLVAKLWGQQILRAAISGGNDTFGIDTPCPWK
jgi:hypothetical protein